jgi:hypothetical protein
LVFFLSLTNMDPDAVTPAANGLRLPDKFIF